MKKIRKKKFKFEILILQFQLISMANNYGRLFNFSAGPGVLPLEVLEEAQKDLLNYKNSGVSIMEMSHRSKIFEHIIQEAENDLRKIL